MSRLFRMKALVATFVLLSGISLAACRQSSHSFCAHETGVASYTLQFRSGLDNFSEDQYNLLRTNTSEVLQIVLAAKNSQDNDIRSASKSLSRLIQDFQKKMDSFSWDISRAIVDASTNELADALATAQTLKFANLIESFVIESCGMPSTVDPGSQPVETLPMPSIPPPTATDPPTNTINEQSEDIALGTTVANMFKLTLTSEQVQCLGAALQGISDDSSKWTSSAKYQTQFKSAFDSCSIPFVVASS